MEPTWNNITTFIFDVDGVLTDGAIWSYDHEEYVRRFYVKDGYAIEKAIAQGYRVIIISGGNEKNVLNRLSFLGVKHIHLGVKNKLELYTKLQQELGFTSNEVLYMGDDIPDLKVMSQVLISACPKDAANDVIAQSKFVSLFNGGFGAVREVIEKVLKARGDWSIEAW